MRGSVALWIAFAGAVAGCPGGDDDDAPAADGGVVAPADGGEGARDAAAPPDLPPAKPGSVTGQLVNDSAASFKVPDGVRFRVSVAGAPSITTEAKASNGAFAYTLENVPAGAQVIEVAELDDQGKPSLDFYQAASRRVAVTVAPEGKTTADVHLKWHWEPSVIANRPDVRTCSGLRQVHFRDASHGFIVFNQDKDLGGVPYPHASLLATDDGGATWRTAAASLFGDGKEPHFRPASGNWFNDGTLFAASPTTLISLDEFGSIARSEDGGSTFARVAYSPPTWGPGDRFYGGVARSGDKLYLAADTGGVQGSEYRSSVARSSDDGKTWQVVVDRCDVADAGAACSNPRNPNVLTRWGNLDFRCGPAGHCISIGTSSVLVTRDHFATYETFSTLGPDFGCGQGVDTGRVIWIPGTQTVWVVAPGTACGVPPQIRRVSTDGGKTWGAWEPSPVSAQGHTVFADAQTAFFLAPRAAFVSHDAGKTFKHTGPVPHDKGTNDGLKMAVVDADHAWITSTPAYACGDETGFAYLARWRP